MIWPFGRKRRPRRQEFSPVPTDETWRPGDIAECVFGGDGPWLDVAGQIHDGPEIGSRSMVLSVYGASNGAALLKLTGWSGRLYCAAAFRKIVLTDTGADRKVSKRKPVGVDA